MENRKSQDQAEALRAYKEEEGFQEYVSVLDLPPRSEVHESSKKQTKWKLNILWIRFLFILLILLIAVFLSQPYWGEWFGTFQSENPIIIDEQPLHDEVTVERNE
ncbi:hypothetical protein LCM20_06910 [Halobacillus litoralis]|uniref:hypothetical protein n=1 Tax=Halobacillus litoralis TaxID=45668 RepID=UPI001CD576B8|nr:hypothetical protein [Halobacillus litoralis]MCA0970313.1 hypothetical protein [Halobacillus litoralis]